MSSTSEPLVIVGASIFGICLAGRVSQAQPNRRVVLVTAPLKTDTPRLINGCSLRSNSIALIAESVGVNYDELMEKLGKQGLFYNVKLDQGLLKNGGANFEFWQNVPLIETRKSPCGGSWKHDHILDVALTLLKENTKAEVIVVPKYILSEKDLATVLTPLELTLKGCKFVNATPRPDLWNASADVTSAEYVSNDDVEASPSTEHAPNKETKMFVALVQAAFELDEDLLQTSPDFGKACIREAGAIAPFAKLDNGVQHLAFVTPFADPLVPEATHYNITTSLFTEDELKRFGRRAIMEDLKTSNDSFALLYGLRPIRKTQAVTILPVDSNPSAVGGVERARSTGFWSYICNNAVQPGAKAIALDGMLCHAVAAKAVAKGFTGMIPMDAVDAEVRDVLKPIRSSNSELQMIMRMNFSLSYGAYKYAPYSVVYKRFVPYFRDLSLPEEAANSCTLL